MPHQARDGETDLRQGLLAYMAQWLKQAFVKRLVSDRESLLATQGQATRQVVEIDERLSRLETRIQKETGSYERQIERLSRELLTAREENLHLIRSQINLLKSEMAAARARVLESEGL
jgi:archaellum component FlaC